MIPGLRGGTRLRTVLICFLLLLVQPSLFAVGGEIPMADNFSEIGQLSKQQNIPLVVFVSREACPYCRTLRKSILKPMLAAGKFEQRAILVEVDLDRTGPVTGFENSRITAQKFADYYRAGITPTLLFLDSEGREIGKRIVGISNLELYGFYLQKSIDEALAALRPEAPPA